MHKSAENLPKWSIGIYTGDGPSNLAPSQKVTNPVLKAGDVTDRQAVFVADPFMVNKSNIWYMFFEIFDKSTNQGDIGLAESSDSFNWSYKEVVIDEPFHLSYPYIYLSIIIIIISFPKAMLLNPSVCTMRLNSLQNGSILEH